MKKVLLVFLLFLMAGCTSSEVNDLTYKYFNKNHYNISSYSLKLKSNNNIFVIKKDEDNIYYKVNGNINLMIIEKGNLRYNIDINNKIYSTQAITAKENYVEGILPDDIVSLKKSYKTGKERINGHKYVFETYKYNRGKTTYYFAGNQLKYIKKETDIENQLYEVLDFKNKANSIDFDIPKDYVEMSY